MTDADYNDVSSLLNDGVNPREGKVARQSLKRKATDYIIINEKLCKKEGDATLIVVKKGEELRHIERVHLETGHGGRDVCLEKLKKGYYWNRMKHDIVHFIAHCHQCQLNRTALSTQNNELRPVRPPRQPCTMYGIDLITLPESRSGNRYAAVAVDYFTKYPFARAIPNKSALESSHPYYMAKTPDTTRGPRLLLS
ncbi:hypothetical protein QR680_010020 [Steinernema hermaphroditum]|uniref:RNA-directed DNA polymerase n=1 Tax=Steinernema hermaphroditum TaxID=289476 RepID=A0AA39IQ01_9BILA|nr:hypothetical protein QR680_010020 [Steinernema hermaphroditum]